jgi:hypothetical protein
MDAPSPHSGLRHGEGAMSLPSLSAVTTVHDHAVTLHYGKVGGLNGHSVTHIRLDASREHILHSALSRQPVHHLPVGTVNDFAQPSVDRSCIRTAASQPLSLRAVRFREEDGDRDRREAAGRLNKISGRCQLVYNSGRRGLRRD